MTKGARPAVATGVVGRQAEERVRSYLETRGYQILQVNFRTRLGEIDLVARDGETVCFIEVRSRARSDLVHPFESVNHRKRDRLRRAAAVYLARSGNLPARFDVVAVVGDSIELMKNAFE
jgi:putative endonuclease